MRKGLLGDLSSVVKTAKRLQSLLVSGVSSVAVFDILDELMLKAFKVVMRAVRFLDLWSQDIVMGDGIIAAVSERPPTPPADSVADSASDSQTPSPVDIASVVPFEFDHSTSTLTSPSTDSYGELPARTNSLAPRSRASTALSNSTQQGSCQQQQHATQRQSMQGKRASVVSHRVSYTGKHAVGPRRLNLASERLDAAHDAFLSTIGSYIGLRLQSRSYHDILLTTQQSVQACQQLIAIVDEVWKRDSERPGPLQEAKSSMLQTLTALVQATRDAFDAAENVANEPIFSNDQEKHIVDAATDCVRTAGDCAAQARLLIERLGDFEFEPLGLGLSDVVLEELDRVENTPAEELDTSKPLPAPPQPNARPPPPPLILSNSKPLPEAPELLAPNRRDSTLAAQIVESPIAASFRSSKSSIPPLSKYRVPQLSPAAESQDLESPIFDIPKPYSISRSLRTDSVNDSVAESTSTCPNSAREDECSIISHVSTRATTPDRFPLPDESSLLRSFGSIAELKSTASDECIRVEEEVLEKTYAHELVYNKERQISGGSLPALVEQLTTHDSTPDASFVTTFYLTFRLFATPLEFAQCLIDRFNYIGESQEIGVPVRLRVYNVFKGWLETHWQADNDSVALGVIFSFATGPLQKKLSAAGKRLAELTAKVTEVNATSRLVSSMGKTSTSVTVYTAKEKDVPSPNVTKSQLSALRNAMHGGVPCSILDFDALELARQFTLIESHIFCSIQPQELLASEWTKKGVSKAVNVRAMSTLSTDLANLVADTILHLEDPKKRAVVIKQWVKISKKCLELNNYDSLMAIICSLNSSMVLRLKKTWDLVPQKTKQKLDELKDIVDVSRNYAVLRKRLENQTAPCIPFVGIYLTDLTFVDVGNQSERQLPKDSAEEAVSVINFDKHTRTAKIIGQLQRFQVPYRLAAVPEMQEWMDSQIKRVRTSDETNVQNFYRKSLLLEPREVAQLQKASPSESMMSGTSHGGREPSSRDRFEFLTSFHFSGSKERSGSL